LQPLSILFGAGFTVAVGYSFGALILKRSHPDPAVRFVTGSALLSALVFLAGALDLFYPSVFLLLGTGAIVVARSEWRGLRLPKFGRVWLIFVPFLVLYLANAMAPEISFDGSRYHLGLVARYIREHGIHPIRENMYAGFPQGIEMLYAFAFVFGRHSAAAVVHLAFLVALTWQVFTWTRREGGEVAGLCAAFLVFASPLMGVDGSSAYNDVAVAAIAFTLFQLLETDAFLAAGMVAGFAFAAKYTAFVAVPYALWRSRRLSVALVAAAVILPWLVKNALWFHNPVAPFFNHYFLNPYVTGSFEREYRASQILPTNPLQLTVWGSSGGLFGPLFLLAPIALLRWRLVAVAAVFGLGFWGNTGARFLIPSLAFVAIAMCLPLARYPKILFAIMGLHAILSWPTVVRRYCHADAWRLDKVTYREALRIKPEEGFLESNLPLYGATRMLDRATPAAAVIFTEVPIPEAYTSRDVRVAYQSASNIVSRRVWFTGFVPEHAPVWRTTFRFALRTLNSITVRQAQTIHEVVAYDGDRELPRTAWRATDPALIDGRLTSFWMAGDSGQSVRVDFAGPERVDRVVVITALDQPEARLSLDGIEAAVSFEQLPTPPDLRRQSAKELRRRGFTHFLAFDGQFGADDLRARAPDWGITQVAEYKGARLYQLP
jgi:hypothetical protein